MSFANTQCNCGSHKAPQTLICPACRSEFADRDLLRNYDDKSKPAEWRRLSGILLLSLARRRRQYRPAA